MLLDATLNNCVGSWMSLHSFELPESAYTKWTTIILCAHLLPTTLNQQDIIHKVTRK